MSPAKPDQATPPSGWIARCTAYFDERLGLESMRALAAKKKVPVHRSTPFYFLGGMALFLFGVKMLSQGMEQLAGGKIQYWLDRATNLRIKGAIFGAVATAVIQSSGLLMVTMIGLINARLLTLEQAIGVMLGQEIGTTITGLGGSVVLTATEKTVTMRVYSPAVGTNFLLKFEGGTGGPATTEKDAVTTTAGQWETLSFVMPDAGTYTTVVVFPTPPFWLAHAIVPATPANHRARQVVP